MRSYSDYFCCLALSTRQCRCLSPLSCQSWITSPSHATVCTRHYGPFPLYKQIKWYLSQRHAEQSCWPPSFRTPDANLPSHACGCCCEWARCRKSKRGSMYWLLREPFDTCQKIVGGSNVSIVVNLQEQYRRQARDPWQRSYQRFE